MAFRVSAQTRINVEVGNDTVVFICRQPSAQEMSEFLSRRFVAGDNALKNNAHQVRQTLIDKVLIDVEGMEFDNAEGVTVPLNNRTVFTDADKRLLSGQFGQPVEGFKDVIPLNLKCSAAVYFEERAGKAAGN